MEFPYDYAGDDDDKTDVSIDLRVRSGRYCSPRHWMPFNPRNEHRNSLDLYVARLADIARCVIGWNPSQETRVQNALDEVLSKICLALFLGEVCERPDGGCDEQRLDLQRLAGRDLFLYMPG
jgi:hypothetical protein